MDEILEQLGIEVGDETKEKAEKRPVPDYGDLMPMEEFIECCECGGFINDDGSGNYSDGKFVYGEVCPSDITGGNVKKEYSHVVWFNK